VSSVLQDLRVAIRVLGARPAWTAAAILCVAIASGANTAAYSLVNGLLLRPLPFEDPERLVMVALRDPNHGLTRPFSLHEYREVSQATGSALLLARTFFPLSLAARDGARMAQTELVSGNYFATLGLKPFIGRLLSEQDDREGAPLVLVLSHGLWQRRFGADPAALGTPVRVNGRSAAIVGVAPPGFVGAMRLVGSEVWLPASVYPDLAGSPDAATVPMFGVMGRLRDGVTREEATARLTSAAATLAFSKESGAPAVAVTPAAGFGVPVSVQGTVMTLSGFIYVMMALLMVVACANVTALVLARGVGRSGEIAVRLSLGASRLRIARQLAVESSVLALAGCAVGSVAAIWLTQALVAGLTTPFQYVDYAIDVHPDIRVFACSAIGTAVAAMLCGMAPLRLARRVDVVDVLKQSAGHSRRGTTRTLNGMVAAQFAVSTTLLVAAAIFARTYVDAQSTRPGFETSGLIVATLDLDQLQMGRAAGTQMYRNALERLRSFPGVIDVASVSELPFRPGRMVPVFSTADAPIQRDSEPVRAVATIASSSYFSTLGVAVREGRMFGDNEPERPSVAVINEAMARRLWPDRSALGQTFRVNRPDAEPVEVIGVASRIVAGPQDTLARPGFYQPFPAQYSARMTLVVRVNGDPASYFAGVQRTIRELNEDLAVTELRTLDDVLEGIDGLRRIPATLFALVGLLGLLLSAVGLYGVVAYSVRERSHELGIRLALGARPVDVRRMVVRQGFGTVGVGIALGTAASIVVTQLLRNRLFGASAVDPVNLTIVWTVLSVAGLAALYLPARWASRVEPARTLRHD
jgi:predicted permease